VQFHAEADQPGRFVRLPGSAVQRGEVVLKRGQHLHAGALSLLASCGLDRAFVYRLPRVSILSSGDELVAPGQPLAPGQIYESNSIALAAAVAALGLPHIRTRHVPDQEAVVLAALLEELAQADVLLLCGGISVGDYDFSGRALRQAGVEEVFYRVAQKPGMPLFFGRVQRAGVEQDAVAAIDIEGISDDSANAEVSCSAAQDRQVLVFGLPGNPASSLVCFWEYARTALRVMMGFAEPGLVAEQLPLAAPLRKTAPRAAFERAWVHQGLVYPLEGQDSYQLRSLAAANSLLVLPEGAVEYQAGELVTVHRI
jgi:molybdopterin molybdotransferase